MGDGQVSDPPKKQTYTQIFDALAPYYLAIGMPYELYWYGNPEAVKDFRKADEIRKRRMNEELWLSGTYMAEAIKATVGNMFSKSKFEYPSEPKPITLEEVKERREREQKARTETMKARFMAKALSVNAKLGGKQDD